MLRFKSTDRLDIAEGKLVRIVTAHSINKKYADLEYDFYLEDEDGRCMARNLYSSPMNGYRVAFPGIKNDSYYYGEIYASENDPFEDIHTKIDCFRSKELFLTEREIFITRYPEFKYTLDKWCKFRGCTVSINQAMKALVIWKQHPEVEILLANGFDNIAFNKNFWRLSEAKRKEICLFLRKNEWHNYQLSTVQQRIKYNLDEEMWKEFVCWNNQHYGPAVSYELYKYLKKQEEKAPSDFQKQFIKETYTDYKKCFKNEFCIHSFKDDYWRFPKDLFATHTRLNDEINRAEQLHRQQEQERRNKLKKEQKKKERKQLKEICKKLSAYNTEIDGYKIFCTSNMDEWLKQATALHQCIVAAGYYSIMARKESLIFFIQKEGNPIATAQVYLNGKIGQFYADELDRNNCRPTQEVQDVFNRFLEKVDLKEVA